MTASRYACPSRASTSSTRRASATGWRLQPLDRPAQLVRGRLVARGEHRHELIADLLVGHRRAVGVRRLDQEREDVGPVGQRRIRLRLGDHVVKERVDLRAQPQHPAPRAEAAEVLLQARQRRHPRGERRPWREQSLELGQLAAGRAEDGAQDRPQRDPLHRGRDGELPPVGELRDLRQRDLLDQPLVGLHPLTLERRQQQAALLQVAVLVDAEQRVAPEHPAQRRPVPGVEHRRVLGEDLLDQVGLRQHHHVLEPRDPEREHRAEAAALALHVLALAQEHRGGLEDHRRTRSRRHAPHRRAAGGGGFATRSRSPWYGTVPAR